MATRALMTPRGLAASNQVYVSLGRSAGTGILLPASYGASGLIYGAQAVVASPVASPGATVSWGPTTLSLAASPVLFQVGLLPPLQATGASRQGAATGKARRSAYAAVAGSLAAARLVPFRRLVPDRSVGTGTQRCPVTTGHALRSCRAAAASGQGLTLGKARRGNYAAVAGSTGVASLKQFHRLAIPRTVAVGVPRCRLSTGHVFRSFQVVATSWQNALVGKARKATCAGLASGVAFAGLRRSHPLAPSRGYGTGIPGLVLTTGHLLRSARAVATSQAAARLLPFHRLFPPWTTAWGVPVCRLSTGHGIRARALGQAGQVTLLGRTRPLAGAPNPLRGTAAGKSQAILRSRRGLLCAAQARGPGRASLFRPYSEQVAAQAGPGQTAFVPLDTRTSYIRRDSM